MGERLYNVTLSAGSDIEMNVTLEFGLVLSGTISGSDGTSIGAVDIDADNLITGMRVYTPNDNSDSISGDYWIVVPSGLYRIRFQPPFGTRWQGLQLDSIAIDSDTLIDVTLAEGLILSGNITDIQGQGLENISVDLRIAGSGEKIYIANNKSDSTGYYNVAVPDGIFNLRFEPVYGSRYVGVAIDSLFISNDTEWDQVLAEGWLFAATVWDSLGNPIEGADLDFIDINTLDKIFTPYDKTDSLGTTIISLAEGGYTIRVDPPPGSFYDRVQIDSVTISSDTSFTFILPESERVNLTGKVINSSGEGLADIEIELISTHTGTKIYIADNLTDTLGIYNVWVPTGNFNAQYSPPQGSRYVGLMLKNIAIAGDTIWGDVTLDTGVVFNAAVYNKAGRPIAGVDLDFTSENSAAEIITPFDDTDSLGRAQMTIPPDIYTIELSLGENTSYSELQVNGFEVDSDTSFIFFMENINADLPDKFALNGNYPNPFNQLTRISYILFEGSAVSIDIYNSLGQKVYMIKRDYQLPGFYAVTWNGIDRSGEAVASGLYFYKITTQFGESSKEMVLIK
jgi:hypothetical protein